MMSHLFLMLRKLSYYGVAKYDKIRLLYSLPADVTINSVNERIFRLLLHIVLFAEMEENNDRRNY
jgi:hypothetical protein